jgi:membrane-bound inhibitor of C-type lysozyme
MNKKVILVCIIILAIGILVLIATNFYVNKKIMPQVSNPEIKILNSVTYYCQEGTIKADYGASEVNLKLKDGRSMTLPQTISGSGIRYELGTATFVSKGDNAFLTENDVVTYTNCVAGSQATSQDINTYTDSANIFSFSYPNQFILSGGDIGFSQDWRAQTTSLGLLLTVVRIPRSFMPQTNFSEAKFTVGTNPDPDAIKDCLLSDYGNMGTTSIVMIGPNKFTKISFADAGAGNYYDTTSYRTIYNNQCYAIEYTIHSTNIYNYSPDQDIKEFDKAKIDSVLESIAQSFKFN